MKKVAFLLSLLGLMSLVACSGDDTTCEDGSTPDACGNCPAGDDDAT